MTRSRCRLNPFLTPGYDRTPMRPLCPWRHPEHDDYYVELDNAGPAFDTFVEGVSLDALDDEGQLTLVTGESGCGKTALVHRCADWFARKLREDRTLDSAVIDLTNALNGRPQMAIEDRLAAVCQELLTELRVRGLVRPDAFDDLGPDRTNPDVVFRTLPSAVTEGTVLIVLLPTPGELPHEVFRYTKLAGSSRRTLLFAESALFDEEDLERIVLLHETWAPPITPRVGELRPGDVRGFVLDRLDRYSDVGIYPRMSPETMDTLAGMVNSVGRLQRTLHGTYETRRRSRRRYDEDSWVTVEDIVDFLGEASGGSG